LRIITALSVHARQELNFRASFRGGVKSAGRNLLPRAASLVDTFEGASFIFAIASHRGVQGEGDNVLELVVDLREIVGSEVLAARSFAAEEVLNTSANNAVRGRREREH